MGRYSAYLVVVALLPLKKLGVDFYPLILYHDKSLTN